MTVTYKLSIQEWRRMVEAGVFAPDKRLEFREGEIVEMTPVGKEHFKAVTLLTGWLVSALGDRALVSPQKPLEVGPLELYPDFALLKPENYDRLPRPEDVLWVVEVSKSSLAYDLTTKSADYASAGVPEYWVADLAALHFEVYTKPEGKIYQATQRYAFSDAFAPQAFPELKRVWLAGYASS